MGQRHLEDEDIELVAREARKALGIEFDPRPDMITAVFKAQHLGLIKSYVRVPDADMPDDLAAFDPEKGTLSLQESTFTAANEVVSNPPGRPRARFPIAHGFGHVFLGHKRIRHRNILVEKLSRLQCQSSAMNATLIGSPQRSSHPRI
jgi:hypothetical protein